MKAVVDFFAQTLTFPVWTAFLYVFMEAIAVGSSLRKDEHGTAVAQLAVWGFWIYIICRTQP